MGVFKNDPGEAIPKPLNNADLNVKDIGLCELNEAFARQVLYCRDHSGINPDIYDVTGGAISIGHPYGMTGARLIGPELITVSGRRLVMVLCIVSHQVSSTNPPMPEEINQ